MTWAWKHTQGRKHAEWQEKAAAFRQYMTSQMQNKVAYAIDSHIVNLWSCCVTEFKMFTSELLE